MDEFALIRRYFAGLTPDGEGVALGVGDDCALLQPPPGTQIAITCDTLIAGRHFPAETAAFDIGWKALAVNLSDLAAMGARPWTFTLALSLPQADAAWLADFAAGLGALAREAGIALVGGDTTRGPLSITVTALGSVPRGAALRRAGARVGDCICVTGTLGDAALALRRWQAGELPHDDDGRALRARLDRPTPRNAAGLALRGIASAAIDLSDGLAGDLGHVCAASGVGAELELAALPASPAFARGAGSAAAALQLAGGDDYELCVCVPPERLDDARRACAPLALSVVGRIVAEPGLRVRDAGGGIVEHLPQAYRHFP
ncbi:thiamine-phosphate kinase [Solimonas variicoloris]|uniref:thiamine-phosphate kinase n=1 Tax=Solimonas variicoloris TaxID=254408 RepID=UPI00037EAF6E|nr:thiamine-phosphate kinase [Solimonas variicoloris]